ncbi:DNA-3-methyladenine glycosylase II (plasmid) [Acetobacter pasteurianus subsp. pasteurianus]|uniref:DNA-3-methyladenine glycosylase II n=1 Tax=Acetobacter pasteurianus subsp. pasteurianus TaxID=481145 RepID=A0A1Y0YDI1_ACEPA|nr:DNA-3-methyladenine glycosylase II [Acetobacter pasteurianus subsp. pasteurianus]
MYNPSVRFPRRGLHKSDVKMDYWLKNAAPSSDLRHWFDHDPAHWDEFKLRYRHELSEGNSDIKKLENLMKKGRITLLYAAHDPLHNHALVLQKFLDEQDI